MRPPGRSLYISGGDTMLGSLWLRPHQLDSLVNHHAAALVGARDSAAITHHTAWLHDLSRVVAERTQHRRAAGESAPLPLAGRG